mgnify:FL=1|tara:strand:+ start:939 stop:1859 length:921 start_codon:yes stop_codon:yes gene_type:complete
MKIFISNLNESWIIDRMKEEFSNFNPKIVTDNIKNSDIIWIIAPWMWKKIPKKYLKAKTVVCSIHHLEEKDFKGSALKDFYNRDKYVNYYHTISNKSKEEIRKLTPKKIVSIPFWINENIFFSLEDKSNLRSKYNLPKESLIIGSFQRDTEGKDLKSPKLIKGPDQFVEIVKSFSKRNKNLLVLLAGYRRQYLIKKLEEENIDYKYIELVDFEILNELYNCLDLYIVSSRIEGGPQAILECGITKTPLISTDVGIATEILSSESIFNMDNFEQAKPNIQVAYDNSIKYSLEDGMKKYQNMFEDIFK